MDNKSPLNKLKIIWCKIVIWTMCGNAVLSLLDQHRFPLTKKYLKNSKNYKKYPTWQKRIIFDLIKDI